MVIAGLSDGDTIGTLDRSGFIGGLTKLYRGYDLEPGDEVEAELMAP